MSDPKRAVIKHKITDKVMGVPLYMLLCLFPFGLVLSQFLPSSMVIIISLLLYIVSIAITKHLPEKEEAFCNKVVKTVFVGCGIIILLAVIVRGFIPFANAAYVVTDPGAYMRMLQELQQMMELTSQVENVLDEGKKQTASITGNKRSAGLLNGLISELTNASNQYVDAIPADHLSDGTKVNYKSPNDISKLLNETYNPRQPYGDRELPLKRSYQQRSLKAALQNAEANIAAAKQEYGDISMLIGEIDNTQTQKEAQDITNKILARSLIMQEKTIELLANLVRITAAMDYRGVDESTTAQALQKSSREKWQESLSRPRSAWERTPGCSTTFDKNFGCYK